MKIHVLSDLHLEFDRTGTGFVPPKTDADVVILAGDIGLHTHGIEWAVDQSSFDGKRILYVLGNHEFYGAEYHGIRRQCRLKAEEYQALGIPIYLLDDDVLVLDGVRFLGCQLWTDYRLYGEENMPFCMSEAKRMNDHRIIRYADRGTTMDNYCLKDSLFLPQHAERLHRKSKAFLSAELAKPFDGKTVVITHHLPSRRSVATRFNTDFLSAAFASNLESLIEKVDGAWIHGHTHDCFSYHINKCHVVCNPRGYPSENFRNGFQPGLVVEV